MAATLPELPSGWRPLRVLSRRENRLVIEVEGRTGTAGSRIPSPEGGGNVPSATSRAVLKCLLPPFAPGDELEFRQEFLLLHALAHPYWVRPARFGPLPGQGWFMEMEEATGAPLPEFPLRGWCPEVLEIARHILSALQALHNIGVAQLDLAPEQVLVEWNGSASRGWSGGSPDPMGAGPAPPAPAARLCDLGLAAPFGSRCGPRGTPGYMAPELLRGDGLVDARADLYAFGSLFFELVTGCPAFARTTLREVLEMQAAGSIPDLDRVEALPPPVRALLRELLSPRPQDRPSGALEVWQRLRDAVPVRAIGDLPVQLTRGPEFVFRGRGAEIGRFVEWLGLLAARPGTGPVACRVAGEIGIGRRRLASRCAAVAQTKGWDLVGGGDRAWLLRGAARELRIDSSRESPVRGSQPAATDPAVWVASGPEEPGEAPAPESLVLRLGPMDAAELESMLLGQGIESAPLRRLAIRNSLGSPGLLHALAVQLPPELDLAVPYAADEVLERELCEVRPPEQWVGWAESVCAEQGPTAADLLTLLALDGEERPAGDLERLARGEPGASRRSLDALAARGLLLEGPGGYRFCSSLWARTFEAVQAARAAELGKALLREPRSAEPEHLPTWVRLALRLGDEAAVRERLAPALEELDRRGRLEEEVRLLSEVCSAFPRLFDTLDSCRQRALARAIFTLGLSGGRRLSACFDAPEQARDAARPLPGALSPPARCLLAWVHIDRRETEAAARALELESADPEERFLQRWLRFRLLQFSGDLSGAWTELRALAGLAAPGLPTRFWLAVGEAGLLLRQARYEEAAARLEGAASVLPEPPPWERGVFLQLRAVVHWQRGEAAPAGEDYAAAERIWREHSLGANRLIALGSLAGIAYQEGDLAGAQKWNEDLLREWIRAGRWDQSVTALTNLSLALLGRGRLGLALAAVEDGRRLALRAAGGQSEVRVATQQLHVQARAGWSRRCAEGAERLLSGPLADHPSFEPFVRASLAESLFHLEAAERARQEYRRAVDLFLDSGARDDAAEALAAWSLQESAVGDIDRARSAGEEAALCSDKASRLTRALLSLVEGETARGGSPEHAAAVLEAAARQLELQDHCYFAWRARWRLGQALVRAGREADAVAHYAAARSGLAALAESLPAGGAVDRFLSLPGPRAFLEEIGRG